ncbi:MAG: hypothetical protein N2235_02490 [Fischerella sp.]|nr:hypothetical protein [Fischerella sp.]
MSIHEQLRKQEAVAQLHRYIQEARIALDSMEGLMQGQSEIKDTREFICRYNQIEKIMVHLRAETIKFL